MAAIKELESRLDAEFSKLQKSVSDFQQSQVREYEDREKRFADQFTPVVERLKEIWRPRLESLIERFKDAVKVQPVLKPHSRQIALSFQSPLARVNLQFSAGHDADVRNLILTHDLEILPVYAEFEKHAELALPLPLSAKDETAVANWLDDRIVGFVRTYLGLQTNQYYLKDHMVEDPVAKVKFPKYSAKVTLDHEKKTYYFIGEETCEQFRREKGIKS
jgi:YHS domain-containing protein